MDKLVCFITCWLHPPWKRIHGRSLPFPWSDYILQMPVFASWQSKAQVFCRNPNSCTLKNGGYNASEYKNVSWGWKGVLLSVSQFISEKNLTQRTTWVQSRAHIHRQVHSTLKQCTVENIKFPEILFEKINQYIEIQINWSLDYLE